MALLVVLAVVVVALHVVRCMKHGYYAPVEENPKMSGHVLNSKFGFDKMSGLNYTAINACYMGVSLVSLAAGAAAVLLGQPLIGLIGFFLLYQVLYAIASAVLGFIYTDR